MPLKAAIPISLTGRFAALGRKALRGAELWAEYSGAELLVEDDGSDPEKAAEWTAHFCRNRTVDAVFGPYSSSLCLAAARAAHALGGTLWNHGGASDEITQYGNVVSCITPASRYFVPVVDMLKRAGKKKVAVAEAEGSGFSGMVAGGAARRGADFGMDIQRVAYDPAAGAERVLNAARGADALLAVGRMEDDIALAERVFSMRERPEFLCFVAAGVDEFGKVFADRCEGVFSVSQWEEETSPEAEFGPSGAEFAAMFAERNGHHPDYPAAQAFNIGLIAEKCAIENAGEDDKALRETAKRLDFTTFYGRFKTDGRGNQIGHSMAVTKWKDGKRVVVEPMGFEPTTSTLPVLRSPD